MNRTHLALVATLLLGAWLRFAHLDFGFPGSYHPDEWRAAAEGRACASGRTPERRYRHPPLQKNLACLIAAPMRPVLAGGRLEPVFAELSLRLVSAVSGTLAPVFVFLVARRLVPDAAAVGAAFFYAVFPAAVMTSKYGPPDSLVSTLVLVSLWLQLRMAERPGANRVFAAALAGTLAVAAKYNAGFLGFSFVMAWIEGWRHGRRRLLAGREVGALGVAVLLGLALGFPAVLFSNELGLLTSGVSIEGTHLFTEGHYGFTIGMAEGLGVFYFRRTVLPASGLPLLVAMAAGLVALAARRDTSSRVLLAFTVPYYAAVEFAYKVPPTYERYMLPLLGVFVCGAMMPAWSAAERGAARFFPDRAVFLTLALVAALAVFPLWRTVEVLAAMDPDTREKLGVRLAAVLPPDARIFAEVPTNVMYYPTIEGVGPFESAGPELLAADGDAPFYVLASSQAYERYEDFPNQKPEWTRFYRALAGRGILVAEEDGGRGRYMFQNPTLKLYRVEAEAKP